MPNQSIDSWRRNGFSQYSLQPVAVDVVAVIDRVVSSTRSREIEIKLINFRILLEDCKAMAAAMSWLMGSRHSWAAKWAIYDARNMRFYSLQFSTDSNRRWTHINSPANKLIIAKAIHANCEVNWTRNIPFGCSGQSNVIQSE